MNFKKFLVVTLLFGLVRICHAAPTSFIQNQTFQLPQSQNSSVSIYPCLAYPCHMITHDNANCETQALQEGVSLQVMF
ncbi:MAG: hypothetical protein K0S29_1277 [Gammaproteobacteria bacterium]|jgi:hypothetical protein|nr:hypothetical protein [Gammaproteobacteria bacterium]